MLPLKKKVMDNSDNNAWTGSNIFAHLNDFEESVAETILETHHSQTVADSNDNRDGRDNGDKPVKEAANVIGNAKIGIKIPKFEATNKNYVLQCQDDMTQEFIDYLKEMSSSYIVATDTGKCNPNFWGNRTC